MAPLYYALASLRDRIEDKERGATAVEYALIVALVSIVLVTALLLLVPPVQREIGEIVTQLGG